jgi:hypothetical protein
MDEKMSTEIDFVFLESLDPGCLPILVKKWKSVTIRVLADLKEIPISDKRFVQLQHPEK